MSSLAQFASGMRQLNCGSSSRFRIHLAQMWAKTNRTKTESMDIRGAFFSPRAEVRTLLSCKVRTWHPFGWRRWATCRVDGSEERLARHMRSMDKWGCLNKSKLMVKGMCGGNLWKCLQTLLGYDIGQLLFTCWWPHWTLVLVLFSQFSFFETHQSKSSKQISAPTVTIISRQTESKHVKKSERERFWYIYYTYINLYKYVSKTTIKYTGLMNIGFGEQRVLCTLVSTTNEE